MSTIANTARLPQLLARLWPHFSARRKSQYAFLLLLTVVSAFAEIVSLGAVLPFLGVLTSPDWVFKHAAVVHALRSLGIASPEQLVLPLTASFVVAALVAGAIRVLLLYVSTRLAFATGSDVSMEVYRRTLYQPYTVHVARNSSEVISGITSKVAGAVNVLYNSLTLTSSAISMLAITVALFVINPLIASVSIVVFGTGYALITVLTRRRLLENSRRIAAEQTQVVKALQEGLGGIRDVLLDGSQSLYCEVYRRADVPMRRADGSNSFIGGCPRPAMEALGMVLIALLAYVLSRQSGGLTAAVPALGALALGAQRLLPGLQTGYSAWAGIVGNQASLADVIALLEQPVESDHELPAAPLPLGQAIRFAGVRFRYLQGGPWVLDGMELTIPKGARVGIVGSTGSGKSTLLDVLMGLLGPTEGELLVDGEAVNGSRVAAWQRTISHVPQSIFLADATLAENIAFGVAAELIDHTRVREAARKAQIAEFIESRPEGYQALIGERGVRLSGGQRQRVGIARALYKRASILVFDEATSALDNATERMVMDAIESLDRDLTIVLIAHRLDSVRRCDMIVEIEHGRMVAQGTYEQLLQRSASFRRIAQVVQ